MPVELHTCSAFSFLRGASLPEELVSTAASLGYDRIALLDEDGLFGAPRFYAAARAANIHAIVGASVLVRVGTVLGRVGLLVATREGYKNLCQLLTKARLRTPKARARLQGVELSLEELAQHREGLRALLLFHSSPLQQLPKGSSPYLQWAKAIAGCFSKDELAIEQVRTDTRAGTLTSLRLAHLAEVLKVPCVATQAVLFHAPSQAPVADVLSCARHHTILEKAGTLLEANSGRYLRPIEERSQRFSEEQHWISAAEAFADPCVFTLDQLGYRFPDFPLENGETADERLRALVREGAYGRYGNPIPRKARQQLEKELALIQKLGMAGYFLLVWDLVRYCKEAHILTQGRGSAANSAVCYALGITAVDPIAMELLFERFLSEERGEWPDIDLDLPSGDQREKVIQYVYRRYGTNGAAMTANAITYRARSSMREVGKALGFSEEILGNLARQLSWGSLPQNELENAVERAGYTPSDPKMKALVQTASRLQNLPRHLGQHPGGMVIAGGPLDHITVLEPAAMPGRVILQWDKDDCHDLGILKVDLLGLGMMAALEELVPTVSKFDGVEIDLAHLPPDDPATYEMLRRADTIGVFQVESRAQMATLPRLAPARFYDLVVEVALIRPGPIVGKMVNPYIERRRGRQPVTYPHPELEPVLSRTLGVPLFQEQLMRVAMIASGFSGGEAEELRRAMGSKRSMERMQVLEQKLRNGMRARGYSPEAEEEVVRGITSFALYGFPESHAASFALLAYASAYLKCHFPASFACSLLNHWPMGFYHPSTVIKDAQRHGVRVLPIDVHHSQWFCERRKDSDREAFRLGLRYVHGLRREAAERIVSVRQTRGFRSPEDLAFRAGLNGRELTTLAELGALASLPSSTSPEKKGWTRRTALWQSFSAAGRPPGALFGGVGFLPTPAPGPDFTLQERVAADYRTSSVTVGPHPVTFFRKQLEALGVISIDAYLKKRDGSFVSVAGAVITRQKPPTAKGFFFLTLEDETGIANGIVEPQLFIEQRAVLVASPVLVARGYVQHRDGVTSLKVASVFPITEQGAMDWPEGHDFH